MALKIEQGSTLSLTDGIKIANNAVSCYVGETIYSAGGYDFPNTNELTNNNTFYSSVVDTVAVDKFSLSGSGVNSGYKIPFSGYYCFSAIVNLFECPFAEHYSSKIARYNSGGTLVKEYPIGNTVAPITFAADSLEIVDHPLSMNSFHTDSLNTNDSLVVLIRRNRTFLDWYGANVSQEPFSTVFGAGSETIASFNFKIMVSVVNPASA